MIIISQDKDNIVNFDNISSIGIYPPFDDTNNFEINAETVNGELVDLGLYATEKRAKEVLMDIVENYNITPLAMVYKMPKE